MRVTRTLALLAALCFAQAGCSSKSTPTAPRGSTPPSFPTRFAVFSSDRNRTAGAYHTWITDLDTGGASEFVFGTGTGISDRHPSITTSCVLLVWQSAPGRGGSQDVFAFNRSSGILTDDDIVNTVANETDPCISPSGTRLAFVRDTLGAKRIRLFDTQTRKLIALPNLPGGSGSDTQPSLDQNGDRIAFVSDRNGNADVFVYVVSTQTLVSAPLLVSPGSDVEPSISKGGRYVAFASTRSGGSGGFDLYLYDLNTSALLSLTANTASDDRDPSVSSDGTRIHFSSNRPGGAGGMDLWLYDRTGGSVTRVTNQNSAADDLDPVMVWP